MKKNIKRLLAVVLAFSLVFAFTGCVDQHPEGEKTNAKGTDWQSSVEYIGKEDYRIAGTSVVTLEILEALGVESEHVVGIPHSDAFVIPECYKNATELGTPMSPDTEILSSLNVDMVLSPRSIQDTFNIKQGYDNAGINSYFLDLSSVEGMYKSIYDLGVMLGKEEKAKELCAEFDAFKTEIENATVNGEPPRVLIIMAVPSFGSDSQKLAATEKSYVGDLVRLAGGINIYGDLEGDAQGFVDVNMEDMLVKDPDLILLTAHANPEECMAAMQSEMEQAGSPWQSFRAYQEGKVYGLPYQKFGMSANLHYQESLDMLKDLMYPAQ